MPTEQSTPEYLFHRATELNPEDRSAFLNEACGSDTLLRRRVENLLRAHENAGAFLPMHSHAPNLGSPPSEGVGTVIGRYILLRKIGEGGFGVVYMAEQREPVKRRVAFKIIKLGMDTRQVVARFEAERQTLALLNHPNIAKVLDAGATGTGRPYFVMELVEGIPITKYCDQENLDTNARVDLVIQVCQAIQHAHQKGIIHRDIKPSNLLVTVNDRVPVPKVIDFGIAKATRQELTEETNFTHFSQLIGTPVYMSPEQAAMSPAGGPDIDTRSDIYSLGVLLYELLTNQTPLDPKTFSNGAYDEIRRRIREEEPLKPSTRLNTLGAGELSEIARRRQIDPSRLRHLLLGDLDWVVMKCLEKDRTRRYETADGLAADLKRYRTNNPVTARPPSLGYQATKFIRRNKAGVLASVITLAALVIGGGMATWQAVRATNASILERQSRVEMELAKGVADRHARRAEAALAASRRSEAELAFDKGQFLGEQGDANHALLWLAHSLKLAPPDAQALRTAIRRGIAAWAPETVPLRQGFPETGHVAAVSITRDHAKLFTASEIGRKGFQLRTWEVATGNKAMTPVERFRGRVSSFKFNRDATLLAVGYFSGAVEIIQLSRPFVSKLKIPPVGGPVTVMEFSPDSSLLLAAHFAASPPETFGPDVHSIRGPSQVRLFDLPGGRPVLQAPLKHPRAVWAAAFSADGTMFVTESGEWSDTQTQGKVHFWNLKGAEIRKPLMHPGSALGLALSPDNSKLLTGHWDFKARLWDLSQTDTNALTAEFPCNSPARFVAFSPRRPDMIFIASFGGTAQLWDIATRLPMSPPLWHHDLVRSSSFSPDGRWIMLGGLHGTRAWKVPEDPSDHLPPFRPKQFPIAFSKDRRIMLVHQESRFLRLQEVLSGKPLGKPIECAVAPVAGAIGPNRELAATIGPDKKVTLWDIRRGKHLTTFDFPEDAYSTAFSPDGETLVTGHFGMNAVLWDTRTFRKKQLLKHWQYSGPIFSICYSPEGNRILTGGGDSTARLWDANSGEELAPSFNHSTTVFATDFSRKGTRLVTTGNDQAARLWDPNTGHPAAPPLRHQGTVMAAQFSPDGTFVLTGSTDRTARLWDVRTGKQIGPSMKHPFGVFRVAFWPDEKTVVVGVSQGGHPPTGTTRAVFWPLPENPVQGTDDNIKLWVEVMTGLELTENGAMRVLPVGDWIQRREELERMEN